MYRLLAIGKYEDRYVIPQAHAELAERLMEQQGACGLDFEGGPGNCGMIVRPRQGRLRGLHAHRPRSRPSSTSSRSARRRGDAGFDIDRGRARLMARAS